MRFLVTEAITIYKALKIVIVICKVLVHEIWTRS